jgi:hypothetical protein
MLLDVAFCCHSIDLGLGVVTNRTGTPGWITVDWNETMEGNVCGRALGGGNPGLIELHLAARIAAALAIQGRSRERLHAPIAYARPKGNTDPDTDSTSAITTVPFAVTAR